MTGIVFFRALARGPGWALCGLLVAFLLVPARVHADALRRIEREVTRDRDRDHDRDRDEDRSSSGSSGSVTWGDGSSSSSSSEAGRAALTLLFFPWSLPRITLENALEPEERAQRSCLRAYALVPYRSNPGLLRDDCDGVIGDEQRTALALSMESGFMLEGVVPASFSARWFFPARVELSGRADLLLDTGRAADRAWMATGHVNYRFAQSRRVNLRTGLGPRLFKLDQASWGVDLLYGLDVFGTRPIIFRMELHVGNLGDAAVGQARATLGGMIGRTEFYAGYDHTGIADAHGGGVKLGGPVAGIRAWF